MLRRFYSTGTRYYVLGFRSVFPVQVGIHAAHEHAAHEYVVICHTNKH